MLSHQSINFEAFTGTNKLPASLCYASICLEARIEVIMEIVSSCCHYFSDLVIIVVPTVIVSLLTIGVLVVVIIILKRR